MTMTERRKYSPSAGSEVKSEMHRYKRGTAKSGPGGRGGASAPTFDRITAYLACGRPILDQRPSARVY